MLCEIGQITLMLQERCLKFHEFSEIQEFCRLCEKYNGQVDVVSGRYCVNAKSFMGLLSLDHSKELHLTIHQGNCSLEEMQSFIDSISCYLN